MGDPPQNHCLVKPCEICGHIGYAPCIIVCCRCKITREHPYCMRIVYRGDADDWVCDECGSDNQIPSSKPAPSKEPSDIPARSVIRKPPRNSKVQYLTPEEAMVLESGAQKKNFLSPSKSILSRGPMVTRTTPSNMRGSSCTAAPPKFSVKPNPYDGPPGFQKLQSNRSPPSSLLNGKLSTSEEKGHARRPWHEAPNPKLSPGKIPRPNAGRDNMNSGHTSRQPVQSSPAISSQKGPSRELWPETQVSKRVPPEKISKAIVGRGNRNSVHTSPQSVPGLPAVSSDEGPAQQLSRETSPVVPLPLVTVPQSNGERDTKISEHVSMPVHNFPAVSSGMVVRVDTQREKFGSGGRKSIGVALEHDRYLQNHPAEFPTWKGKFDIMHDDDLLRCRSFNGIQAHPPCKVHRKVYDLSKKLPETLQFELLPRCNFWVNLFEDDVPDVLDIGLYLLSPKSLEQTFISLLEFVDERDLLLRTVFHGVELLLFSSIHLPKDSQRINQKLFLWGLFREYVNEGEDMDIDMTGGYEVGVPDKVVQKPAENSPVELQLPLRPAATVLEVTPLKQEVPDGRDPLKLPLSPAATVLEVTPLKEIPNGNDPVLSSATSFLQGEQDFERDLQRCFDRFFKLKQPEDSVGLGIKVKEEPGLPGSR